MPLTTGSLGILPSTSMLLWPSHAVFHFLLKGEIPLQCWQSRGRPNRATYWKELLETAPHPDDQLLFWWRRIQWMPVGFDLMGSLVYALALFLSQNSKGSQFLLEISWGPLYSLMMVEKNSSQRSEGQTNVASISAPWHVATSQPKEELTCGFKARGGRHQRFHWFKLFWPISFLNDT